MPIDNITLLRHEPTPKPRRPRPWWMAPMVLLVGAVALLSAAVFAWGDTSRTRVVVALCMVFGVGFYFWRLYQGWLEDGLTGMFYRDRYPMGSAFVGDEERDGLVISFDLLASLAVIITVVLLAGSPGALSLKKAMPPPPPPVRGSQ